MSIVHGTIHWTELNTHDPARAAAFYRDVLGWRVDEVAMDDAAPYRIAFAGDTMVAGIFDLADPSMAGVPDSWITYVAVDDVDAAAEAVRRAGGTVHRAPFDVPGVGRFVIAADPGGATLGLITPAPPTEGPPA